jgi:DNA-directed RNA polymerase specialized sigma24 family protein
MRGGHAASVDAIARAELSTIGEAIPASVINGSDEGEWYAFFFPRLRNAVVPLVGYLTADDVAQVTLLEVFDKWKTLPRERRTLEWLCVAARHRALDELQREDRYIEAGDSLDANGQLGVSEIRIAEFDSDMVALAVAAAKRMPPRCQEMWALILEGTDTRQAARSLNITYEAARFLKKRTVAFMRDTLLRTGARMNAEFAMRLLDERMRELLSRKQKNELLSSQEPVKRLPKTTGEERHD